MPSHPRGPLDDRLVIGIAGRIGAGKTSAAKYLSSAHSFQYLRYSQVLSDWMAKEAESKIHLQEIGWAVMTKGMQAELNRRLIAHIRPDGNVAVDGLRHPIDYESLKNSFPASFHLLYVDSAFNVRSDRLRATGKYADAGSFRVADSHPVEQQIESLQAKAALVIRNEGSFSQLYATLDEAIKRFRKEGHT